VLLFFITAVVVVFCCCLNTSHWVSHHYDKSQQPAFSFRCNISFKTVVVVIVCCCSYSSRSRGRSGYISFETVVVVVANIPHWVWHQHYDKSQQPAVSLRRSPHRGDLSGKKKGEKER